MVIYKFFLKVGGSLPEYSYALDLKPEQEDNPEQIFTQEIRQRLQKNLQEQSLCTIKEEALKKIIQTWKEDIKAGYRESKINLNLPLLIEANLEKIQDQGEYTIPDLVEPDLDGIEPCIGMLPPL